MLIDSYGK